MTSGKAMPCDAKPISYQTTLPLPDNDEILTLVTPDGRVVRGMFDPDSEKIGYTSHFATCPNANQHRRNK